VRARIACCCLFVCAGAAVANDVPPPPADFTPGKVFSTEDHTGSPVPPPASSPAPYMGPSQPAPMMQAAPPQRFTYWRPVYSGQGGGGGGGQPDAFAFGGYVTGLTTPIDGTVDQLYNTGVQFQVEMGRQWAIDDEGLTAFALTGGLSVQSYFPADNRNVIDAMGVSYGLGNLTLTTFKTGAYVGSQFGGFDAYLGMYTKLGVAYLDEDFEGISPGHDVIAVQELNNRSFAGGVGVEAAVALLKLEKSSLALVVGCEYLYMDTFPGQDHWTFFSQTGLQWEFDITDGFFGSRDRCPREGRRRPRRERRMCRPF